MSYQTRFDAHQLAIIAELMNDAVRHDNNNLEEQLDNARERCEALDDENLSLWNALNHESRTVIRLEEELEERERIIRRLNREMVWLQSVVLSCRFHHRLPTQLELESSSDSSETTLGEPEDEGFMDTEL